MPARFPLLRQFTRAFALSLIAALSAFAQSEDSLSARIQRVMNRPEFAHSNFGIEFMDLDSGKILYSLNPEKLFVPASTTKTLTEGTLLAVLGPEYRFHTNVYRTGPVKNGTLKGDLILVASGDPNLSNRIQPDGTLIYTDEDHSYNGPALAGDPLAVLRQFAKDIAAKGIRKVEGNVYVDASLLPDAGKEGGTGATLSSIVVNDNFIDLVVKPGAKEGDPAVVTWSPQTAYFRVVNGLKTGAANSKLSIEDVDPIIAADGSVSIPLTGSIAANAPPQTFGFAVPSPTQFATFAFRETLAAEGVQIKPPAKSPATMTNFAPFTRFYTPENLVATHVSPPLSEEVKITLKVSQNLHASLGPYLLGLIAGKDPKHPLAAGFKIERTFLTDAKLDLSGASQGDGEGGDRADLFSPDFMVHYMAYWHTRPDFQYFFKALPVLGKDGTLAKIQPNSPAAGHVFAKTGTFDSYDQLNARFMLNAKGLVGFVQTKSGRTLAFAAYLNNTALSDNPQDAQTVGGQALGEIAAAAYDAP